MHSVGVEYFSHMFQGLIHIRLEELRLPEDLNLVHCCEVFKACSCARTD